ncbi:purine phosphorylase [Umezawaea sp. NPDC059074]|uniref:5'-methylthioadenosine/S-adenosylhomocysteine nucleosidase family protein n=1 Tax=Umezawaea sp. NPDC059074 TaxID=3346716 RepID=UPI0036D13186
MIVILTALESEHAAVLGHLTDVEAHTHRAGTLFDVGVLKSRSDRRIAVAATGMGNLTAAALTERAVVEFQPSAMLFVGIAGGLRDWLELGDVVVATRVYAYHGGRSEDDGFHARPRSWDISHKVEQVARRVHRAREWHKPFSDGACPEVHFAPVAAGEVVLDSRTSEHARHLDHAYNDAVAVEMESAGFALAGHLNDGVPMATVRSISDRAGGAKNTTDDQGWQSVAARNAAAFAVALAEQLDDAPAVKPTPAETPVAPQVHNTNVAKGNATVGQQIGVNHGAYYAAPRQNEDNR